MHAITTLRTSYVEWVKLYLDVNDIKEEKQLALFLSVLGANMCCLPKDLVAPHAPLELKLDGTIDVLQDHFKPWFIVIAKRFHFQYCCQVPCESAVTYVAQL